MSKTHHRHPVLISVMQIDFVFIFLSPPQLFPITDSGFVSGNRVTILYSIRPIAQDDNSIGNDNKTQMNVQVGCEGGRVLPPPVLFEHRVNKNHIGNNNNIT